MLQGVEVFDEDESWDRDDTKNEPEYLQTGSCLPESISMQIIEWESIGAEQDICFPEEKDSPLHDDPSMEESQSLSEGGHAGHDISLDELWNAIASLRSEIQSLAAMAKQQNKDALKQENELLLEMLSQLDTQSITPTEKKGIFGQLFHRQQAKG